MPSAGRIAHTRLLKTFRQIRDDVTVAQRYHPRFQEDLPRVGIPQPTPAILALAYYLTTDRLWTQDGEAGTLLAQQSPEVQVALRTWAHSGWRRGAPWDWTYGTAAATRRHKSSWARRVLPFFLLTRPVRRDNLPPHWLDPPRLGPKVPVPPILGNCLVDPRRQ
jgi:hypothetical protein